jgi:hypothetical protein
LLDGYNFHKSGCLGIYSPEQYAASAHGNNGTATGIVETKADLPGLPNELSIYSLEGYFSETGSQQRRDTFRLNGFASPSTPL